MQVTRSISHILFSSNPFLKSVPAAGLKSFAPPATFDHVEFPERNRLKVIAKVPQYPAGMRAFKMQKRLRLMRGPEKHHNTLLHRQYGIVATAGGRMQHRHFEVIRLTLLKHVDFTQGFAIWRVSEPWQPITKKSQGQRMGGGKGSIDHYVTPVKADQVIIEVGGMFEYFQVRHVLHDLAHKLPFAAMAVSQEIMDRKAEESRKLEMDNQNPWTWKYIIQNNMIGCNNWISKYDRRWFMKYL